MIGLSGETTITYDDKGKVTSVTAPETVGKSALNPIEGKRPMEETKKD